MTRTRDDLEIVRPSDVDPQPWANGLGVTRVLVSRPDRRISIAEIEGRTPFSSFDGSDRVLVPLGPSGVTLEVGGRRHRVRALEPFSFRGEDPIVGDAGTRRTTVVNVMTVRSCARLDAEVVREVDTGLGGVDALVLLGGLPSTEHGALPPGTVILPGQTSAPLPTGRRPVLLLRWTGRRARTGGSA